MTLLDPQSLIALHRDLFSHEARDADKIRFIQGVRAEALRYAASKMLGLGLIDCDWLEQLAKEVER